MFRFLPAALALVAPAAATAQTCAGTRTPAAARLTVEATGVRSGQGEVSFTIYPDDRRRWLAKHGKLTYARVAATPGTVRACFWLPAGAYAVAFYHDENMDRDFNRVLFTPKEGFGFSRDAVVRFALPSFASARFALPAAGTTMRMATRYRR